MFAFTHLRDCQGEIPLHLAAASGCPKTLGHLLRCFPNFVNHESRVGETPVMFAAVEGEAEALQLLFKSKARLQVHSNSVKSQRTCLELAVTYKMSDTASIILDHDDWKAVGMKPSSNESASHRKLTCDDTRQSNHRIEINQKSNSMSTPLKLMSSRMSTRASHRRLAHLDRRLFSYISTKRH